MHLPSSHDEAHAAPDGPEGLAAAPTRVIERGPQPNFARNLTRSLFEIAHKRCNSNDANSMFEQATGELRATLLGNHTDQRGGRTHRQAAPVTWHYTRSERVHCLRIGCIAYGSGAPHNAGTHHRRVCRPARITRRQEHTKPQNPKPHPQQRNTGSLATPQSPRAQPTNPTPNTTRPRPVSRPRPRHSVGATQRSGASDQAVMSTWSSTAARPASRRATGTRNGEQDT